MACFIVSAAEAVVVTAVKKAEEKKELSMSHEEKETAVTKIPLSKKLSWLLLHPATDHDSAIESQVLLCDLVAPSHRRPCIH